MSALSCQISGTQKLEFARMAHAHGLREAELLRHIVSAALAASGPLTPGGGANSASPLQRMTLRLPAHLMKGVAERAALRGLAPARWVALLVAAHLSSAPVLERRELLGLQECSSQLRALGRNLNQLTRHLHAGGTFAPHDAALLGLLLAEVQNAQHVISSAVAEAQVVWHTEAP